MTNAVPDESTADVDRGIDAGVDGDVESGAGLDHELDAPPWRRVESTLMATAAAIRHAFDERLAPIGLNLSLASLLSYVADFGPVTQTRVAEHLGQGRAVTGTQIDRLELGGLVERRPDPSDRRVWLVAITSAGADQVRAVAEIDRVLRAELRAGICRADRQTLAATLVRLQQNVHRSLDPAGSPADPPATTGSPRDRDAVPDTFTSTTPTTTTPISNNTGDPQ